MGGFVGGGGECIKGTEMEILGEGGGVVGMFLEEDWEGEISGEMEKEKRNQIEMGWGVRLQSTWTW